MDFHGFVKAVLDKLMERHNAVGTTILSGGAKDQYSDLAGYFRGIKESLELLDNGFQQFLASGSVPTAPVAAAPVVAPVAPVVADVQAAVAPVQAAAQTIAVDTGNIADSVAAVINDVTAAVSMPAGN